MTKSHTHVLSSYRSLPEAATLGVKFITDLFIRDYVLAWITVEGSAKLAEQYDPNRNKTALHITKHQTTVGIH